MFHLIVFTESVRGTAFRTKARASPLSGFVLPHDQFSPFFQEINEGRNLGNPSRRPHFVTKGGKGEVEKYGKGKKEKVTTVQAWHALSGGKYA